MDEMDNSVDFDFDSFFDGFEGEDGNQTDTGDDTEETAETGEEMTEETQDEPESVETAEEVTEEEAEEDGAEGKPEAEKVNSEQKFTIKVNKESKEVGIQEMTELAQKGADYDRVKGQLETTRQNEQNLQDKLAQQQETIDTLNEIAAATGKPLAELLEQMHVNAVRKEGQTDAEVRAEIRVAKLQKQLDAQNQKTQPQRDTAVEQAKRDLEAFRKQFPDVPLTEELAEKLKPDILAGMSMTSAYLKAENARKDAEIKALQEKQAADAQNKRNRAKSPGSMRDSGGRAASDYADVFERTLFA